MAQVQVLDVIADVAQLVRQAPNTTLIGAYIRAARKFCRETRWLRVTVTGQTTAGSALYTLGTDPYAEPVGLHAVSAARLTGNTKPWALRVSSTGSWNPSAPNGRPTVYSYVPEGQFALHQTPDDTYALTMTVVVQPKKGVNSLDDSLLVKWDQALQDGALGYLMDIEGMPWSNPAQAERHRRAFQSAINNAKADVLREYNAGSVFTQRRPFLVGGRP